MSRKLLYLTPNALSVYPAGSDYAQPEARFDADLNLSAFAEYLAQQRKTRFLALTNLAEEGFQYDTIPFLGARDRQLIVSRRLGQLFQSAPMSVAISLGYEKDRRKNERVLFASLNNGELLEPWMATMGSAEARLEGVHSVALLGQAIVEAIGGRHERRFLLTMHGDVIRQSYFEGTALRFSRLSRLTDTSIVGLARGFQTEAGRLYQYLLSQRTLTRGKPVTVLLVAEASARTAIENLNGPNDLLDSQFVDAQALAQRFHFHGALPDSNIDPLYLHLLATRAPRPQFAPPALRRPYQRWYAGRLLYAAAASTVLLSLPVAALYQYQAAAQRKSATEEQHLAAAADQQYMRQSAGFPKLPVSHDRLRAIMADVARLREASREPRAALVALSRGLDTAPDIELERIEWHAPIPGLDAPASGIAAEASPSSERLIVRGRIRKSPEDTPRQVLARFDAFVDRLGGAPGLSVKIQQNPYDIGSDIALSSRDDAGTDAARTRPFSLLVRFGAAS